MELRHLRYFVAAASAEHLSKAARRIHVSVSPLSRQIRQLEDELGVRLFRRVGRGVRLTHAGTVFLKEAQEILASVDRAVVAAQDAERGQHDELRIGFVDSAPHMVALSEMVHRFRADNGGIAVKLCAVSADELWTGLSTRVLDVAFACGLPSASEVRWQPVFSEPLRLVVPREHPLAARDIVFARDLENEPLVWIHCDRPGGGDPVREALTARGIAPRIAVRVRTLAAALSMAASGLGLAFGLEATALPFRDRVVTKSIADVHVEVHGVLAWHVSMDRSPLIRALLEAGTQLAGGLRETAP
jgi:DNA-binding transcriptional LysR family regulator